MSLNAQKKPSDRKETLAAATTTAAAVTATAAVAVTAIAVGSSAAADSAIAAATAAAAAAARRSRHSRFECWVAISEKRKTSLSHSRLSTAKASSRSSRYPAGQAFSPCFSSQNSWRKHGVSLSTRRWHLMILSSSSSSSSS